MTLCPIAPCNTTSKPKESQPRSNVRTITITGNECEPFEYETSKLATEVFPLLPKELQDTYVSIGRDKNKTPQSALAYEMRGAYSRGGLNSTSQLLKKRATGDGTSMVAQKSNVDWGHITRSEAFRFIAGYREYRDGEWQVKHTPLTDALTTFVPNGHSAPIIESLFFPNSPLAGEERRKKKIRLPANITAVSDGDTVKLIIKRAGCQDEEMSIRFVGIDTPEKFRSISKFWPQVGAIMNMWKDKGLVTDEDMAKNGPLDVMIANRIEYIGAISSLIMTNFINWVRARGGKFWLEETFTRGLREKDDKKACDMVDMYDVYYRGIWVLHVEPPALIGEFIRTQLATIMATEGKKLWDEHQLPYLAAKAKNSETKAVFNRAILTLNAWVSDPKKASMVPLLDPKAMPTPEKLFPRAATSIMASTWDTTVAKHPDRAGDINLAMVAMGAAYVYMKYLNNLSDKYYEVGKGVQEKGLGLWGEEYMKILDVNAHGLDKVKKRFTPFEMPVDCTL